MFNVTEISNSWIKDYYSLLFDLTSSSQTQLFYTKTQSRIIITEFVKMSS